MLSLRDKLRQSQGIPQRPPQPVRPRPQDCLIRQTRFALDIASLPEGILPLMQGDSALPRQIDLKDFLFLDTETTGLSGGAGTVAFLVGVGQIQGKELLVSQYLMRDYDEESFVLQHVAAHLRQCRALVTYNGRSFDMPLLASRFILHRMRVDVPAIPHVDLLHTARRVWKLRLGCCSLANLEKEIFHTPRVDDLPGGEIPARYFAYLAKQDLGLLEDILRHNAQDIDTLAQLLFTLASLHESPLSAEHVQDIYSLGRIYDKRKCAEKARLCYRAADAGSMSTLSRERLAANLRCDHAPAAAAVIYQKMISAHQGGAAPYIALSKLYEHQLKQPAQAAKIARQGLLYLADQPADALSQKQFDDLSRRYARLLMRCKIDC